MMSVHQHITLVTLTPDVSLTTNKTQVNSEHVHL